MSAKDNAPELPWRYQQDDTNAYEIKDARGYDVASCIWDEDTAALIVSAVNRQAAYEALLMTAKKACNVRVESNVDDALLDNLDAAIRAVEEAK